MTVALDSREDVKIINLLGFNGTCNGCGLVLGKRIFFELDSKKTKHPECVDVEMQRLVEIQLDNIKVMYNVLSDKTINLQRSHCTECGEGYDLTKSFVEISFCFTDGHITEQGHTKCLQGKQPINIKLLLPKKVESVNSDRGVYQPLLSRVRYHESNKTRKRICCVAFGCLCFGSIMASLFASKTI